VGERPAGDVSETVLVCLIEVGIEDRQPHLGSTLDVEMLAGGSDEVIER
jgi:hypothetical protein